MPHIGLSIPGTALDRTAITTVDFARGAEQAGVHSVWATERIVDSTPDVFVTLGAMRGWPVKHPHPPSVVRRQRRSGPAANRPGGPGLYREHLHRAWWLPRRLDQNPPPLRRVGPRSVGNHAGRARLRQRRPRSR